jgi:hypothetical protein
LADWIAHNCEYDWNSAGSGVQGRHDWNGICNNDIRGQPDYLRHMLFDQIRIASGKTNFNLHIASIDPAQIAHPQQEFSNTPLRLNVLFVEAKYHEDSAQTLSLLRMRRKWPSGC